MKSLLETRLNLTKRTCWLSGRTPRRNLRAGEGGTLIARYGENDQQFTSGKNIPANTKLVFDAEQPKRVIW